MNTGSSFWTPDAKLAARGVKPDAAPLRVQSPSMFPVHEATDMRAVQ